jgi:hypothetical protein
MKSLNIKSLTNWKLYFTLLTASALFIAAILPFIVTVQADVLKSAPEFAKFTPDFTLSILLMFKAITDPPCHL